VCLVVNTKNHHFEQKNAEPVIAPLSLLGGYFRLILDMVGRSQEAKCALKYVIHTPREAVRSVAKKMYADWPFCSGKRRAES